MVHVPTPTREEVLAAAERLLEQDGPAALSMRRLAGALGTSYQVVYSRVGGKPEVARALHDLGFERLVGPPDPTPGPHPAVAAADDETAAVHAVATGYLAFAEAHPQLFELMFGAPVVEFQRDEAAREVEVSAFRRCWLAACRRWLDAADVATPEGTTRELAWRLWTGVHGITVLHLAGHGNPAGDVRAEVRRAVDRELGATLQELRALGPRPAVSPRTG